jgi:predicted ArsR family transcriptional regulator
MLELVRRSRSGLTAAEVANATGLHGSTVRAHLDQLTGSGLLTRTRQGDGSPGRPAWLYQAVAQPDARPPADGPYHDLAAALVAHVARDEADPHRAAVRAGREWGRSLAARVPRGDPLDGVVRVLDGLGFTPAVVQRSRHGSAVVQLRSCPFLDLALANPDVVCGVHLGVIEGALGVLGAPAADTGLEPFAVPGACVVKLRTGARRAAADPPRRTGTATPRTP